VTHYQAYNPESRQVLWEGVPQDAANVVSGGRVRTSSYRLTADALHFASGVLSNREESIPLWAIRDADIIETMFQKARGVSDLQLVLDPQHRTSFGQAAVILRSIRDARNVRDLILRQANAVRQYWADQYHRRGVETARAGAANVAFNEPTARRTQHADQAPSADDVLDKLARLGEMKNQGLLSEAEFAAAKAKLLGL
jgi:hypothetical protein